MDTTEAPKNTCTHAHTHIQTIAKDFEEGNKQGGGPVGKRKLEED